LVAEANGLRIKHARAIRPTIMLLRFVITVDPSPKGLVTFGKHERML
jgi:hypothetical protein